MKQEEAENRARHMYETLTHVILGSFVLEEYFLIRK
jgi:hypothetical protein